jgi:hypothetical protein
MPNNKNNWQFWICNSHWLPFLPCKTVFSTNQWAIIIEFLRVIIPVATKSEDILTYHQEAGKKEEGRMTLFFIFLIYIYIYISASNWHRRCASTFLFLLSYTTPTSQPIDFKDLLIFYLISNIFFKNTLTLKNYYKHTTSSITTT